MLNHALIQIVDRCGKAVLDCVAELQDEAELFASRNTLAAVEANLRTMAQTLGGLPPELALQLIELDWSGWRGVYDALVEDGPGRRELVWYGVNGLVPATLVLVERLQRQRPELFELSF